ncbi:permease prefix domain 1-containing protein [Brachyspira pilosicoli]|uniref:Permease prefix domain 1-containing protein n=1 Tax=Brachyspira pilosicoli TaxID=52584 RepID=A0AAJ6G7M3_BRAPL|nr:permease prefix domain 1-containing protein [Brachyspira pilosicoli]WIH90060.1 permease prefix domain 1-containing protein [Brachyspira pilosicoli]WIH92355.1 permease prefix domain 1-containing protein [Brachyspira pilosicoli]WIH94647.1 permease prefix domain 1-containing protein [Brachyspira pilosicoli]
MIDDFCNELKNKYPNTQKIRDQIEELRNYLYMKSEEYIDESEDEAFKKALKSFGDVDSLLEELSKDAKIINKSKLYLFAGIIDIFIAAFLSLLLCFISLKNNNISFFSYINNSLVPSIFFIVSGLIVIFLTTVIQFINMRNIYETFEYTYNDYKINLKYSIIGFLIISIAVFIFNMFFTPHHIWFVFVIIYFLSWPLTVFFFYRFFKNSDKNINRK